MKCQQLFNNSYLTIHRRQFLMIFIPRHGNLCTSTFISSTDETFQKIELNIWEFYKPVNYELALLNKKIDSFSRYLNQLVSSSLSSQPEKSSE